MPETIIESLDHEGRGVAHLSGKTIFIEGALPLERVEFVSHRKKANYELASAVHVFKESALRTRPRCPHFGVCGGCSMQHLDPVGQAAAKQRVLEDAFWHVGRVKPDVIYPAIYGPSWGYRSRARLAVRLVQKKGGVLVGFHEKRSSNVADMDSCDVVPADISAMLPTLRALVAALSIRDRMPQIEVAVGDQVTVLVLRVLQPPTAADEVRIKAYADDNAVQIWLQLGGPESARPFHPLDSPPLSYTLPDFDLHLAFRPTDFTQVNHGINRSLVRRAMSLLAPLPDERIGDLFCGLGNFTLPIARCGAHAIGVEGSAALVARAHDNAEHNGLAALTTFSVANLFEATEASVAALGKLDKLLIDPPREGAMAVVKALSKKGPARIVYISCSPATLARDAGVLVHEQGYRLRGAGIANMFPQTSHVESIALFEK